MGLVHIADGNQPRWVEYPYCFVLITRCLVPSKLAVRFKERIGQELAIPVKLGIGGGVENNLVSLAQMAGISEYLVLFSSNLGYTDEGPRLAIIHSICVVVVSDQQSQVAIRAILYTSGPDSGT